MRELSHITMRCASFKVPTTTNVLSFGFPPIASPQARVLILGTLPGRLSIDLGEYYANPLNAFWRIMATGIPDLRADYASRVAMLSEHGIAVWDVLAAATRSGSLDSAIANDATPNNFRAFFQIHPGVRLVCFNGVTAADLYEKHVVRTLTEAQREIAKRTLPSTSSAHARLTLPQKAEQWSILWTTPVDP
jgi:TDG/mug DNA glycosylase family protein